MGHESKISSVQLICNTGIADVSDACRRLYGQFNNIMSVLGRQSNEILAVYLTKTYCLPTLMRGMDLVMAVCVNLTLLGTTLFVEFFHVAGERARVLCSSFVNHYHFIFS